ncbi:putative DNA-binding domain-containing protein [Rhodosalinus sp.]|uniref:HvfC/BufC family peptide modification chaperone n=1 Tax=Rhodosalinus sp. TaxID=2047741 RepID=UPI003565E7E8
MSAGGFRAALLDPGRPAPAGLADGAGHAAGRRFDVYRNNVHASLVAALQTGFPALRALLGAEIFRGLALAFVRAHPPRDPRLMLYGDALPAFVEGAPALARFGWAPDLARLELALRAAYHAGDAAAADPAALGAIAPEHLAGTRVTLAPAVSVLRSRWPVAALRAHALGGGPRPDGGAEDLLVTRPGFDPVAEALPPGGAVAVAALAAGETLGTAQDAGDAEDAAFDLGPVLGALLRGGAITGLRSDSARETTP